MFLLLVSFAGAASGAISCSSIANEIMLSSYLAPTDDAVVKLSWPDSSTWINSGSTLPTYDSADGSWVFNRSMSQYFDAGARTLNPQSSGFTVTARVMVSLVGFHQRIIDFGSGPDNLNILLSLPSNSFHFAFKNEINSDPPMSLSFQLNTWFTITLIYSAVTTKFQLYIDGALRFTLSASNVVTGPRVVSNCYIGRSHYSVDAYFSGRMKFLAAYDRALSEAEIFSQHTHHAPANFHQNVTMSVSFIMPVGVAFTIVSVTGLRFSHFNSSSAAGATCSNLNISNEVVPFVLLQPNGLLNLTLSLPSAAAVSSSPIVCRIPGFTNALKSASATSVQISIFNASGMPLLIKSNIAFPEILIPSEVNQTNSVLFAIAAGDRIAAKAGVPVTLTFTTQTALAVGGKITLNYPAGFFAATPNPANNAAGSTSVATMTAASAITGNSIVITTAVAGIAATTTFTITLSGLTMGAAAVAGCATGITVQTDSDTTASAGAASGAITSQTFVMSQSPPITAGLIAHYNADSWTGSQWTDLSGALNHVTEVGGTTNISVARPVGAPAYVQGASTAWMKFPAGILPSAQYTLFFVARYNGPTQRRILQGVGTNWLSGFHWNKAGGAHHHTCGWITANQNGEMLVNLHGSDWVVGSERSDSFRSNGVDRTSNAANGCQAFDRLAINTGLVPSETSDFAIQSILVYNVKLSVADVQRVEAWLNTFQPAFTPANLQASVCVPNQFSLHDIHLH